MIAIAHHHLRRGGVTRVVMDQARLLVEAGEKVRIVTGEAPVEPPPDGVEVVLLDGLAYDAAPPPGREAELAEGLRRAAAGGLLHAHNPGLGKNLAYTAALLRLAGEGQRLLLQIHDFAEDGRPGNLRALRKAGLDERLYPLGPNVAYAVLQSRDRRVLEDAGIPEERLAVLPNLVAVPGIPRVPDSPPKRVLYLTRAIRRKNLGELVFWAMRHRGEMQFATSLTPENPDEKPAHAAWVDFAREERLDLHFGLGETAGPRLEEVVGWADACITTSVAEGFGMSFLEPWCMGRPLLGRDLPSITEDFRREGLDLSHLYTSLPVPAEAVDPGFWMRAVAEVRAWRGAMGALGDVQEGALREAWLREGRIDFGRLDGEAQRAVLRAGAAEASPELRMPTTATEMGAARIRQHLGPVATLRRLRAAHALPGDGLAKGFADASRVRAAFLRLETFSMLRT